MTNDFTNNDYNPIFQAYVVWVDQNGTVEDKQKKGVLEDMSPQTGRNLHIGVIKLNGEGGTIAMNVLVPVGRLGEFKLPKPGDVVWIEESRRSIGSPPVYLYSTYNTSSGPDKLFGYNPVPQWGSIPGDQGEIISYRDHIRQFVPTNKSNFKKKYIKSITGHRFRQFYRSNLKKGRFAVRGDAVFDIDGSVSSEYLVEEGAYILEGGALETDQGKYPNPLNVPAERQVDEDYTYYNYLYQPIEKALPGDQYSRTGGYSTYTPKKEKQVLKNKNYVSYQPVLDKKYLEYAEFERELPAAEEYQIALRGNNKLLIQDQYGDGEQLLITLKNQYDAGITIIQNSDKGQVRVRDHMGQGVLLEANPDSPRVMLWTANKQVIEQGSVKGVGEFTYIRNGAVYGDAETSYGTKTGLTKNDVSNQEFLITSSPDIVNELSTRLSSGMQALAGAAASAGFFFRNNIDPDATEQTFSLYKSGSALNVKITQDNFGHDGSSQSSSIEQMMDGSQVVQTTKIHHLAPGNETFVEDISVADGSAAVFTKTVKNADNNNAIIYNADTTTPETSTLLQVGGDDFSKVTQDNNGIIIERLDAGLDSTIKVGDDGGSGAITVGSTAAPITIQGTTVTIEGSAVNVNQT